MQIIINTIQGTYVVPAEKQADLIYWLQANAIKVGQEPVVREQVTADRQAGYVGRQLINE